MGPNKGTEEARKPRLLIVKPGWLTGEHIDAVGVKEKFMFEANNMPLHMQFFTCYSVNVH